MGLIEIFLIALSLSMDAFAVSICKGMFTNDMKNKAGLIIGLYFGFFQAVMPLIGYFLGKGFSNIIGKVDHFIVFILLLSIGLNMIKDSLSNEKDQINSKTNIKEMIPLSVATSIDALAIGISFAFLKVNIISSVLIIGIICFFLSFIGVIIGNKFGSLYEKKAGVVGGLILIIIGIKTLLIHLNS